MLSRLTLLSLLIPLGLTGLARAETPLGTKDRNEAARTSQVPKRLGIGDAAPKLTVKEFIKGKAVTQFERGKIYVVELWATGCGPCRAFIPHLTALQKWYPDITVIGVGVWGEDVARVKSFVEEKGEKMDYRVAVDLERTMEKDWLLPTGVNAVPTVFIVDGDGKISWFGHAADMDEPLEKIHSGKWNLKVATAEYVEAIKGRPTRWTGQVLEAEQAAVQTAAILHGRRGEMALGQEGKGGPITIVNLSVTRVTDTELKEFKGLKECRVLSLVSCDRVTDAGLKEVKEMKSLQTLLLGGTRVTDAGLQELKGLKGLRELGLGRTQVTDAGLKELKGLKELRWLFLVGTKVTDAGLKELKELKELRQLFLSGTEVTDAGVAELKKALPGLAVER